EVTFSYNGEPVLKKVNLASRHGERLLVVGPNGSGKTTLANILAGYLAPDEGEVVLPARRSCVTIPVEFPPLKVRELPIEKDLLRAFSLEGFEEELADNLSAGQRQKLAIALSLSQDAELCVFDEPLSNVDVMSSDTVMAKIMELTRGKTAVVIMHGGQEYHHLFDRVLTLDGGQITASR
ncbi:TPA: ABC transporter ATP-binding protein, partial [Candidatus Acetothermia bacterium]|nr:ABC transporter ATP-binding protein [Candidatus Acetothermia bacterium]